MMRLLIFPVILLSFLSSAQTIHEQVIKSPIHSVKLFLTAGEIQHKQKIELKKGRNRILFSGISAFADPQSIQFAAQGSYSLVSMSTEMDFLAAEQFNPRISILQDSLELLKDLLQKIDDNRAAYEEEMEVLRLNRELKGENQNMTVPQLKEAGEFFRTRTLEIREKLSKLKKERTNLFTEIEKVRFQLLELNYHENQRSNQVVIILDAVNTLTIESELKYLVSDCGWAATYDLSATDLSQKINLKYKAQVYNNTGNEWKDVQLTLSTGDPRLSATHPEMEPWYLSYHSQAAGGAKYRYYAPQVAQKDYRQDAVENISIANQRAYDNYVLDEKNEEKSGSLVYAEDLSIKRSKKEQVGNTPVQMRQIEISQLTSEFVIANLFSCPSDAKPYAVEVKEMNLDATFSYIAVPKLDNGSFLMAHIVGWQDLELIPGPTNVFFGGKYVGVSEIDTRNVEDTLSLSFGRDSKVIVMRKLKKEMSTKKVMGSTKRDSYVYEISVRNNRTVPVTINVYDQVPISQSSEIVVSVDNVSKAKKDEVTGETVWLMTLQPGEVQTVELGYSVKYPKDAQLKMQKFKTISAPSF